METISMRNAFLDRLYDIAQKDPNVILLSADMGAPGLDKYKRDLERQFLNVGIAEQNMVTVATGLALEHKKVYIYAIIPFVTSRCYEMLKVNLSLMNIPITAVGVGSGFSYDDSGPTHHSTEDIAIMRALPNMTILNASDSAMAAQFAETTYKIPGPSYVRLDRSVLPTLSRPEPDFSSGISRLRHGKKLDIVSTGNMVHRALEVSRKLEKHGVETGVVDLYRLKPVNRELLLDVLDGTKIILTLEEHMLDGGLGSIMAEFLADSGKRAQFKRIGIQNKYYYAYGGRENIQRLCGLDSGSLERVILDWTRSSCP